MEVEICKGKYNTTFVVIHTQSCSSALISSTISHRLHPSKVDRQGNSESFIERDTIKTEEKYVIRNMAFRPVVAMSHPDNYRPARLANASHERLQGTEVSGLQG